MREATGRMEYFSNRRDKGNQSHYWLVIQTVSHGQNKCRNVPKMFRKHPKFAAPLVVCTYNSTEIDALWNPGVFYSLGSSEKYSDPVVSKCINLVNHRFSIFHFFVTFSSALSSGCACMHFCQFHSMISVQIYSAHQDINKHRLVADEMLS